MPFDVTVFHQSLHLDDEKLEPPEPGCPFCGATGRRPVLPLQDAPEVRLLLCASCHAASASRMPKPAALAEYYSTYYESPRLADSVQKVTFNEVSRFGRHLASTVLRHHKDPDISILDFGGGDGSIAHAVAVEMLEHGARGAEITIVDTNKDTLSPPDGRISMVRKNGLEEVPSEHSLVMASAVIEHVPKPREVLDGLLARLRSGGIFYARTPYMLPLMKLLAPVGVTLDFTFPGHVHDLGQSFWEGYFSRIAPAGAFQILKSKPSIVETTVRQHFVRTVAAHCLKAPWYLLGRAYKLVGGWEVFVRKR